MKASRSPTPPPLAECSGESGGQAQSNVQSQNNGHAPRNGHVPTIEPSHPKAGFNALVEEAQSIQNGVRDLLLRTNQLLVGLKAYRRHAKSMQSTLASLRQLQQVEA